MVNNIEFCCSKMDAIILMGRDKAYPEIFHTDVLKAFENRLYKTDDNKRMQPKFLEIDWHQNIFDFTKLLNFCGLEGGVVYLWKNQ
jgi:hypothetical protein